MTLNQQGVMVMMFDGSRKDCDIMLLTVTVDDNDDVLQCAGEVARRPYKEGLRI